MTICTCASTGCVLLLISSIHAVEITTPPQNAVALTGSSVQLTCGLSESSSYNSYFEWRAYIGDKHGGTQIYFSPPFTPKSPRYHQFGDYGLEIRPVEWRDAGKYSCVFLTGDSRKSANIVVMGKQPFLLLTLRNSTNHPVLTTELFTMGKKLNGYLSLTTDWLLKSVINVKFCILVWLVTT